MFAIKIIALVLSSFALGMAITNAVYTFSACKDSADKREKRKKKRAESNTNADN